jgi:hypothetical protein
MRVSTQIRGRILQCILMYIVTNVDRISKQIVTAVFLSVGITEDLFIRQVSLSVQAFDLPGRLNVGAQRAQGIDRRQPVQPQSSGEAGLRL